MFFNYRNKEYEVNVKKTLEVVDIENDYYPDLLEEGVAVKEFDGKEDFSDCENVILFYNYETENVTIQLCKEDYETIRVIITPEETDLIRNFFNY